MEKRTLTTGEVASYCNVSFTTVIRWIKAGRLKGYQLPGRGDRRIQVPDFLAFLRENGLPVPPAFEDHTRRALVVDDDAHMVRIITNTLENAGFETAKARSGFSAGRMLERFRPALMTLDLRMPGLGGLQVIKSLRENEHHRHVRVLVISGLERERLNEALRAGADDILPKPFTPQALLEKVEKLTDVDAASIEASGRG